MNQLKNPRFLIVLGTLLISSSLIIEYYFEVFGFINGFLNGMGLAALIVGIIWFLKNRF